VDDAFNTEYTWFTEEERNDNMQGHIEKEIQQKDDKDYVF
jgi:hypothetical protein